MQTRKNDVMRFYFDKQPDKNIKFFSVPLRINSTKQVQNSHRAIFCLKINNNK